MSLTSWVTDYLFVPLSMALRRFGRAGMLVSLSTSMVVIGLWHGLSINFLIFGLWHATFVGLTALSARWRDRLYSRSAMGRIVGLSIGIVLTFLLMTISLVFWHNAYWSDAIERFRVAFSPSGSGTLGFAGIRTDVVEPLWICMLIAAYAGLGSPGWRPLKIYIDRLIPNWMQYGLCLLMISALTIENGTAFVYGQF
jgi:D-alanyl-lipoteichoic acid acyltransferase DltB (MBOAT superfamily)